MKKKAVNPQISQQMMVLLACLFYSLIKQFIKLSLSFLLTSLQTTDDFSSKPRLNSFFLSQGELELLDHWCGNRFAQGGGDYRDKSVTSSHHTVCSWMSSVEFGKDCTGEDE